MRCDTNKKRAARHHVENAKTETREDASNNMQQTGGPPNYDACGDNRRSEDISVHGQQSKRTEVIVTWLRWSPDHVCSGMLARIFPWTYQAVAIMAEQCLRTDASSLNETPLRLCRRRIERRYATRQCRSRAKRAALAMSLLEASD